MRPDAVRLSAGTAAVLGLSGGVPATPPTTAYIMVGQDCVRSCAFCAQAATSTAARNRLSRVAWQQVGLESLLGPLRQACRSGALVRACLQVVGGHEQVARDVLATLHAAGIDCSVTLHVDNEQLIGRLLETGASKVSLPLDACGPDVFAQAKGGSWDRALSTVERAAAAYPGRIATHLVAGLGETEQELLEVAAALLELGVTVGLFAFTPVPGTAMELLPPPPPVSYRRLQAAMHLLKRGWPIARLSFRSGSLQSLGASDKELLELLASGAAFETSGCSGCNRPYYNESVRGFTYNYARPLLAREVDQAIDLVLGTGRSVEGIAT